MKAILFGATGMVGRGVFCELLLESAVDCVLSVVRNPGGQQHPNITEVVHKDFFVYADIEAQLNGYDACFFGLGVRQNNQCNTLAMAPSASSSDTASISVARGRSCVTFADFARTVS